MKCGWKWVLKDAAVAYFKAQFLHLPANVSKAMRPLSEQQANSIRSK
jgi:hypothetical protein